MEEVKPKVVSVFTPCGAFLWTIKKGEEPLVPLGHIVIPGEYDDRVYVDEGKVRVRMRQKIKVSKRKLYADGVDSIEITGLAGDLGEGVDVLVESPNDEVDLFCDPKKFTFTTRRAGKHKLTVFDFPNLDYVINVIAEPYLKVCKI